MRYPLMWQMEQLQLVTGPASMGGDVLTVNLRVPCVNVILGLAWVGEKPETERGKNGEEGEA